MLTVLDKLKLSFSVNRDHALHCAEIALSGKNSVGLKCSAEDILSAREYYGRAKQTALILMSDFNLEEYRDELLNLKEKLSEYETEVFKSLFPA